MVRMPNSEYIVDDDDDESFVFGVVDCFASIIIRTPFIPIKQEYTNNNQCRFIISTQSAVLDRMKKHDNDMIMSTNEVVIIVKPNIVSNENYV